MSEPVSTAAPETTPATAPVASTPAPEVNLQPVTPPVADGTAPKTVEDLSKLSIAQLGELQRARSTNRPKQFENTPPVPVAERLAAEAAPKADAAVAPEATATAETAPEVDPNAPKVEVTPETTPEPEETAEAKKDPQYRLRGRDPLENAFLALLRAGKTVPEANAIVYGEAAPANPTEKRPEAPTVEEAPAPKFDEQISAIDSEIAKLEADKKKAVTDANLEEYDRLTREIHKKERDQDRIKTEKAAHESRREYAQRENERQAERTDFQEVCAAYPDLAKEGSKDRQSFDQFILTAEKSPKYARIFDTPYWRSPLASVWAQQNGKLPAQHRMAPPPVAPQPVVAPKEPARPPTPAPKPQAPAAKVLTTRDAPSVTAEITPQQLAADFAKLSPKEQAEVMRVRAQARAHSRRV